MNREIKFRAWLIKEKKMIPVDGIDSEGRRILVHDLWFEKKVKSSIYFIGKDGYKDYELMQYIGRKDKNGKEIYEGDILGCIVGDRRFPFITVNYGEMTSCDCCMDNDTGIGFSFERREPNELEIIGNIYENPAEKPGGVA